MMQIMNVGISCTIKSIVTVRMIAVYVLHKGVYLAHPNVNVPQTNFSKIMMITVGIIWNEQHILQVKV